MWLRNGGCAMAVVTTTATVVTTARSDWSHVTLKWLRNGCRDY
jgi:hypothetical protein